MKYVFASLAACLIGGLAYLLIPLAHKYPPLLVFCDVGQGDGTYIRLENGFDIVIDGGPDSRIVSCVQEYRDPRDPDIDLVLLTHADKDHYEGLNSVFKHFQVRHTIFPAVSSPSPRFQEIRELAKSRSYMLPPPSAGDRIRFGSAYFTFFWPPRQKDNISKSCEISRNEYSYIHAFSYRGFDVLFTGDVNARQLTAAAIPSDRSYEILKVPHHGSKHGLNRSLVLKINPIAAVISVGMKNPYKHPHNEVIRMLQGFFVARTDLQGAVVFRLPLKDVGG